MNHETFNPSTILSSPEAELACAEYEASPHISQEEKATLYAIGLLGARRNADALVELLASDNPLAYRAAIWDTIAQIENSVRKMEIRESRDS